MRRSTKYPFVALLLALPLAQLSAQTASQGELRDLLDTSCAQFQAALLVADPGENPSEEQSQDALAAQDDLFNALLWVHGYLSGRDAGSEPMKPLNITWLIENAGKVKDACDAAGPEARFVDAVATL